MSDGSIVFDTKLDTTEMKKGLAESENAVRNLQKELAAAAKARGELNAEYGKAPSQDALSQPIKQAEAETDKLKEKIAELQAQLSSLQNEFNRQQTINEQSRLTGQFPAPEEDGSPEKLEELSNQIDILKEKLAGVNTDQLQNDLETDNEQLGKVGDTADDVKSKIAELKAELKDLTSQLRIADSNRDKLYNAWEKSDFKDNGLREQLKEADGEAERLRESIKKINDELSKTKESSAGTTVGKAVSGMSASGQDVVRALRKTFTTAGNTLKKVISTANSAIGSLIKKISSAGKSSTDFNGKLSTGIKKVLMYGFGIRSLFVLFNKLRSAITAGIQNMMQVNNGANEVNNAVTSIQTSLTYLRNAWAAAFAPILEYVAPVLTTLIDMLAAAGNAIARFMAMLTGKSTYQKAVKGANQYAKAATGAGKAAKQAADDIKGSLASIDEVNDITQNQAGSSGSGGSGGGGGLDYGSMFETADVAGDSIIDAMKKAIENGDWEGAGKILADKVNSMFASVDWEGAGKSFGTGLSHVIQLAYGFLENLDTQALGSDIAAWLNGAINSVDWNTLGSLMVRGVTAIADFAIGFFTNLDYAGIAQALNNWIGGALSELQSWVSQYDFSEIGGTIANGLSTVITGIDWNNLGTLISTGMNSIIQAIYGFTTNVADHAGEWGNDLSNGLTTMLNGIQWDNLSQIIVNGINGLTDFLNGFVSNEDQWVSLRDNITNAINNVFENSDIAGLSRAVNAILQWFVEGIQSIDWTAVGKALGTALGNIDWVNIMQTVCDAILKVIVGFIGGWFTSDNGIKTTVVTGLMLLVQTILTLLTIKALPDIVKAIGTLPGLLDPKLALIVAAVAAAIVLIVSHWDEIKEAAAKVWDKITEIWGVAKDWFNDHVAGPIGWLFSNLWSGIKDVFGNVKDWFSQKFSSAKDAITQLWEGLPNWFSQKKQQICDAFSNIKEWFSEKFSGAKQGIESSWSSVTGFFGNIKSGITSKFQNVNSWFRDKFNAAKDGLKSGFSQSSIHSHMLSVRSSISSVFSNIWSTASSWGRDMMNGFKEGIERAKDAVTGAAKRVASGIKSLLHFSRPDEGPLRDYEQWMPDMMEGLASGIESSMPVVDRAMAKLANHMGGSLQVEPNIPDLALGKVIPAAMSLSGSAASNQQETMQQLVDAVNELREQQNDNSDVIRALETLISVVRSKKLLTSDVGKAAADYANSEYERTGETIFEGV